MASIGERFKALLGAEPARTKIRPLPTPPQPTAAEVLHSLLHRWAREVPPALDEHLAATVEAAHTNGEARRDQHAELSYWLGYERAIRDVRLAFEQWKQSEPKTGNPPLTGEDRQGGLDA